MPNDSSKTADGVEGRYRSYLLRLWQEAPGGECRVLLQDVVSNEPHYFTNLESLFAYLNGVHRQSEEKYVG